MPKVFFKRQKIQKITIIYIYTWTGKLFGGKSWKESGEGEGETTGAGGEIVNGGGVVNGGD